MAKVIGSEEEVRIETVRKADSAMNEPTESLAEPVPHIHAKTILLVLAVYCIYFAQLVNIVGSGARAQDIALAVGGSNQTVWLTSVIAIATVVLGPPVSQAADYWGRKWFLVILTSFGAIGSIIISRANSMPMVIAGMTITGLSYGAQPLVHAVPSEVLPRRYRPYAQAGVNMSCAMAGATALLVGGALTRHSNYFGFRIYWYITAVLYAGSAAMCVVLYNPPPRPLQLSLRFSEKIKRLDWIGYVLLCVSQILFCLGLSWAENPYPWRSAHVLAPFLIGVAISVAFLVYETVVIKDGMLHHDLFKHRNFPIALGGIFIDGIVFFAANNYFPYELSVIFESDSLRVGLRYSVAFFVFTMSALAAGIYCSATKRLRIPLMFALSSFLVFNICMATATPASSKAVWAYPIFLGLGLGICLCTLVTAAQLSTPPELISITSGLMIAIRSLAGTIGLPVYSAIFKSKLSAKLVPDITAAVLPLGLPKTSLGTFITDLSNQEDAALATIPGVTGQIIGAAVAALRRAYSDSFRFVWVTAACFVLCALVAAFFLVDPVNEFTTHIDAPAERDEELYGLGSKSVNDAPPHGGESEKGIPM